MEYFLGFANLSWIWFLIPALASGILFKLFYSQVVVYNFSLTTLLKKANLATSNLLKNVILFLRFITLLFLIALCLKPRLIDKNSKTSVEGIDIILNLDASGSMSCFDSLKDQRSRFQIAKEEAINFIDKRDDDQIGLVLFGRDSITRCPLTLDKNILKNIISELELGVIDYNGTSLGISIVTACNRLRKSKAKSKIIILLTDGEPSPGDLAPDKALEIAKKLGIKIYTIGIGSAKGAFFKDPFGSIVQNPHISLNVGLLKKIAQETGGRFFLAENARDMRKIYTTIDQLEKTVQETDMFSNYQDLFLPLILIIMFLVLVELFLTSFCWFGVF